MTAKLRMRLCNHVRPWRQIHRLSRDALANRTGVAPMVITNLEIKPGYTPSGLTMVRLCNYFNTDLENLFYLERIETGEPEPEPDEDEELDEDNDERDEDEEELEEDEALIRR